MCPFVGLTFAYVDVQPKGRELIDVCLGAEFGLAGLSVDDAVPIAVARTCVIDRVAVHIPLQNEGGKLTVGLKEEMAFALPNKCTSPAFGGKKVIIKRDEISVADGHVVGDGRIAGGRG